MTDNKQLAEIIFFVRTIDFDLVVAFIILSLSIEYTDNHAVKFICLQNECALVSLSNIKLQ